ncbi:nicotinate phosphoribosyltransferase [Legionella maioricensis]|uniref:Nicotinate phosphoribosyltransferase n=1 Tax=Legionella maioricensis TaxID=2896528 RepID=A0A9X2IBY6_9GAMM|nr:nicotinate phosphoribosyltransferase [Legionella maioricensis]MCL9683857.1 nicotinate phosphoribosyltransferase [Legionella maioricensis]MCL9686704.1 nicotinate phosphoribosyltransferase [Legionella maioricensis]
MFNYTGTYTDLYQLKMAQVYFLKERKNHEAVFDYFFRKLPFEGGYAVFAGLEDLLEVLHHIHFDTRDIAFLQTQGFHADFLEYLKNFRFKGTVYAPNEGEIVFPTAPVVTIEANIIEAQIIETILLNILNFQTLIATKASRMRQVAGHRRLIDFGLRRAQGPGGYYASRAAIIGGFDATSNVRAGRDYTIPIVGTMAHSFVQSYEDELSAFRDFAEINPDDCILLVDTYNTLKSGVPNAIKIGKEMEARGQRLKGIRLDSGDLGDLSKKARHLLNEAGLKDVKITASNQLDEDAIKTLLEEDAPIDAFGVGTNLVIGRPDAALDGVFKLAFAHHKPRIKLSENATKTTLPYKKQVYRIIAEDGLFGGADVIALTDEEALDTMYHPFESLKPRSIKNFKYEPLLHKIMENGIRLSASKTLKEIAQYSKQCLDRLPAEYKCLSAPHLYQVGLSSKLKMQRDQLIEEYERKSA